MNQRPAMILAAGVAAFSLVAIGAVLATVTAVPPAQAAQDAATPTAQVNSSDAAFAEREAEYRKLIEQANQRIETANNRIKQLEQQLSEARAQAQANTQSQANTTAQSQDYPVSAEQAAQLALLLVPDATLTKDPELVDVQGVTAYEVVLNRGTLYVDANTGRVLFARENRGARQWDGDDQNEGEHDDD